MATQARVVRGAAVEELRMSEQLDVLDFENSIIRIGLYS